MIDHGDDAPHATLAQTFYRHGDSQGASWFIGMGEQSEDVLEKSASQLAA